MPYIQDLYGYGEHIFIFSFDTYFVIVLYIIWYTKIVYVLKFSRFLLAWDVLLSHDCSSKEFKQNVNTIGLTFNSFL